MRLILLILFIVLKSNVVIAQEISKPRQLKDIIDEAFKGFVTQSSVMNTKLGKVQYSTEPTHVEYGNNDLIINLEQVEKYTKDSSDKFKLMFVKFIMAHEIAHKMQLNGYSKEQLQLARGEQLVFLECDADIVAGLILSHLFNNIEIPELAKIPGFEMEKYKQEGLATMITVYKRILEMDRHSASIRSHPVNEDRLFAFRQGMIAGNCFSNYFLFQDETPSSLNMTQEDYNRIKQVYDDLGKAINFDPYDKKNNNPFIWAHREAILITHENNSLARNLILYNTKIKWDTSALNPIVSYSFELLNKNKRPVRFISRLYTELIPRNDRSNIVTIVPVDAIVIDKVINAGANIEISGKLNWKAFEEYMPNFSFPGTSRSLYYVFDRDYFVTDTTSVETYDADFTYWNNSTVANIGDFVNYLYPKRNNFFSYTKGIGSSYAKNPDEIETEYISYDPIFEVENHKDQRFYLLPSENDIFFSFIAFKSFDGTLAKKKYREIIDELSSTLPQLKISSPKVNDGNFAQAFTDNNGKEVIEISYEYKKYEKKYAVTIEINGSRQ